MVVLIVLVCILIGVVVYQYAKEHPVGFWKEGLTSTECTMSSSLRKFLVPPFSQENYKVLGAFIDGMGTFLSAIKKNKSVTTLRNMDETMSVVLKGVDTDFVSLLIKATLGCGELPQTIDGKYDDDYERRFKTCFKSSVVDGIPDFENKAYSTWARMYNNIQTANNLKGKFVFLKQMPPPPPKSRFALML